MNSGSQIDIAALLQRAVPLHQQGKLDLADALYQQILQAQPAQFDALHLSGVIARQRGDAQMAIDLISRAITIVADNAVAHCNLGAALQDVGRAQDALLSYERAIAFSPRYAMALNNRGNALKNLGRADEALASYDQALAIQPVYAEAYANRGILLQTSRQFAAALENFELALKIKPRYVEAAYGRALALFSEQCYLDAVHAYDFLLTLQAEHAEGHAGLGSALYRLGQYDNALTSFQRAVAARPTYIKAYELQGNTLRALERYDEAATAYEKARDLGGDTTQLNYVLAGLGRGTAPPASPAQYVADLFDQYAPHFNQHLTDVLKYDTPRLLIGLVEKHLPAQQADTLDLGCGTGLCGPLLRPYSQQLIGVDLSQNMLDRARQLDVYDHLHCAELTAFLNARTDAYDLIVAADVFVYIGDLSAVFQAVHTALRHGGIFSFSVERHDGAGYTLQRSTRYAHSLTYLQQLAVDHRLTLKETISCVTRQDNGKDIDAYLIIMTRGAG